jgi:anti-sigma regulatory factor (Ser/Thr protein kinase)
LDTEFAHPAYFYRGLDQYLAGVGGFLRDGLAAGEPVFASVPPQRLGPLREFLGADADRVQLHNMAEVGRNPGRIMTALTDFASRRGPGRAWLVGEPIWASRTPAEVREATRHEALINLAFAGIAVTILCPYDLNGLSPATLADAERTHPVLWQGNREWTSPGYTDPVIVNADCDVPEDGPVDAVRVPFGRRALASVRAWVREFGRAAGLSIEREVDLVLAVGEAASNAVRYGGGGGTLSMWRTDGELVVEVRDSGQLTDPLAGRVRPSTAASGGRGLWLMHQLCDLVELGPGRFRLHMSLNGIQAAPAPAGPGLPPGAGR